MKLQQKNVSNCDYCGQSLACHQSGIKSYTKIVKLEHRPGQIVCLMPIRHMSVGDTQFFGPAQFGK